MNITLTDAQLAVLRLITDGCPDGVVTGQAHKKVERVSAAFERRGENDLTRLATVHEYGLPAGWDDG